MPKPEGSQQQSLDSSHHLSLGLLQNILTRLPTWVSTASSTWHTIARVVFLKYGSDHDSGQKLCCLEGRTQTRRDLELTFPIPVYFSNISSHLTTQLPPSWPQHTRTCIYTCTHTYTNTHTHTLPLCSSHPIGVFIAFMLLRMVFPFPCLPSQIWQILQHSAQTLSSQESLRSTPAPNTWCVLPR